MSEKIPTEVLLADCLIRISVIERIIIEAGLASKEKINEEIIKISSQISDLIMKEADKANAVHNG